MGALSAVLGAKGAKSRHVKRTRLRALDVSEMTRRPVGAEASLVRTTNRFLVVGVHVPEVALGIRAFSEFREECALWNQSLFEGVQEGTVRSVKTGAAQPELTDFILDAREVGDDVAVGTVAAVCAGACLKGFADFF